MEGDFGAELGVDDEGAVAKGVVENVGAITDAKVPVKVRAAPVRGELVVRVRHHARRVSRDERAHSLVARDF